jgi:hypothetical protein
LITSDSVLGFVTTTTHIMVRSVSGDETAPLLGKINNNAYVSPHDADSIDSRITITTSRSHSIYSNDSPLSGESHRTIEDDGNDIVAKRLNGVSLYTILFG